MNYKLSILVPPISVGTKTSNGIEQPLMAKDLHYFKQLADDMNRIQPSWTINFIEGYVIDTIDSNDILLCLFFSNEDVESCLSSITPVQAKKIFLLNHNFSKYVFSNSLLGYIESRFLSYYDMAIKTEYQSPKEEYTLIGNHLAASYLKEHYKALLEKLNENYDKITLRQKSDSLSLLLVRYFDAYLKTRI